MNDTFRDQTGDDDLRDLLVRAGADAPMPHDWHDVVDRFDRAGVHRDRRRRRSLLAVAAVIAVVGLLGVVAALQVRSGDDGDEPVDRPPTTVTGQVTDPLAGVGSASDHAIVTYDDASTATARRTPSGWTLVTEPPDAVPTTTAP